MKHILNHLSTSRRVANTQEASHAKQSFGLKEVTSQVHDIPKHGQNVQNLIGDYQRPPEVFDRDTRSSGKAEQTGGSGDPILNQQWDEPLHMQPPMIPTTVPMLQQNPHSKSQTQSQDTATNTTSHQIETPAGGQQGRPSSRRSGDPASVAGENVSTFMTHRQIETLLNEQQESRLNRETTDQLLSVQGNVPTPTRHQKFDQTSGKQCTCHTQSTNGTSNQGGQVTEDGKRMTGKLFVNNYFVGDNNWRTVAREKPDAMRQINESRNRSSIAVQTAVSLLGEEDKPAHFVQTGISRMKAMGNSEGVYDTQSPLVVEPAKTETQQGGQRTV